MAYVFNEFNDTLAQADYDIRSYLEHTEAYLELKVLMRLVTAFDQTAWVNQCCYWPCIFLLWQHCMASRNHLAISG